MSGFHFPPPPPPPPKRTETGGNTYEFSRENRSVRERVIGTGRGNLHGRGRGRGQGYVNVPQTIPQQLDKQSLNAPAFGRNAADQAKVQSFGNLPAGSYVNPLFRHNANFHETKNIGKPPGPLVPTDDTPATRAMIGHKRKLELLRETQTNKNESEKPTAPSVPRFGASTLSTKDLTKVQNAQAAPKVKPANALGLTPQGDTSLYLSSESEGDEGMDEESLFAELGAKLTFEHNGTVMSLNNAAEIALWKKDRAKNFPTKARMAEKLAEKRQLGNERERLLYEAHNFLQHARQESIRVSRSDAKDRVQTPNAKLSRNSNQDRLAQGTGTGAMSQSRQDTERIGYSDNSRVNISPPPDDIHSGELGLQAGPKNASVSDLSVVSRDQETLSASSSILLASSGSIPEKAFEGNLDNDAPPEQLTTKIPATNLQGNKVPCKFFKASGYCRDGETCRYKHELPDHTQPGSSTGSMTRRQQRGNMSTDLPRNASDAGGRKSIYDRLVEQEQGDENILALQVIKYLGKVSFFAKKTGSTE